jgi:hypothetical protein
LIFITAKVEGEEELRKTWDRVVAEIRVGVSRGVGLAAKEGAAEARARHTFKNRTGDLERSIRHVVVGWQGDTYVARVVAGDRKVDYASYVEEGTPPHLIPGNPFLTFEWKGETVHFRYVNHPGTKPQPFMHLAYQKAERVIYREIEIGVAKAARILER